MSTWNLHESTINRIARKRGRIPPRADYMEAKSTESREKGRNSPPRPGRTTVRQRPRGNPSVAPARPFFGHHPGSRPGAVIRAVQVHAQIMDEAEIHRRVDLAQQAVFRYQHVRAQQLDSLTLFVLSVHHVHHLLSLYQKRPLCAIFFDKLCGAA